MVGGKDRGYHLMGVRFWFQVKGLSGVVVNWGVAQIYDVGALGVKRSYRGAYHFHQVK